MPGSQHDSSFAGLSTQQIMEIYNPRPDHRTSDQCKDHHSIILTLLQQNRDLQTRITDLEIASRQPSLVSELLARIENLEKQAATAPKSAPVNIQSTSTTRKQNNRNNATNTPSIRPHQPLASNHRQQSAVADSSRQSGAPNPPQQSTATNRSQQQAAPNRPRGPTVPNHAQKPKTNNNSFQRAPKSHNLIVYGLTVSDDDATRINSLMSVLTVPTEKLVSFKRIPHKDSSHDNKPRPVIIQLDSNDSRKIALQNINKVLADNSFDKVYVKPDRDINQRNLDKRTREKRDNLNSKLEHTLSSGSGEQRYGINEHGNKYYYGISNGVVIMKPFVERD